MGFIFVTAHCYIIRTPSGTRERRIDFHKDWTQKNLSQWHHLFDCTPSPRMSLFVFFFIDSPLFPGHVKYFFNGHIYMTFFDICMICDMFCYINLWLFLCVKVISWVNQKLSFVYSSLKQIYQGKKLNCGLVVITVMLFLYQSFTSQAI